MLRRYTRKLALFLAECSVGLLFQVFGHYANLLCPDDERSMLCSGDRYIFVVGRCIKGIVLSLLLENSR